MLFFGLPGVKPDAPAREQVLCGPLSVGVLYIWVRWDCFRLAFACSAGEVYSPEGIGMGL